MTLVWPYVKLPYDTSIAIQGQDYPLNLYNPLNDSLRFVLFIFLPLSGYFFYRFFYGKITINLSNDNKINKIDNNNKDLFFYTQILIIIVLFQFLSLDFKIFISNIDMFHEGLWLTASSNAIYTDELWQSSYVGRGLFGNFYNYFLWKFININSIGFSRFIPLVLTLCNKILFILIAKSLIEKCLLTKVEKNLFLIILSFLLINLFAYDVTAGSYFRLFLILIFSLFILNFFDASNNKSLSFIGIGLLSSISMFWFIDVGFFINFLIIIFSIFLIYKKFFRYLIYLWAYIILGWLFCYTLLPEKEFLEFISNTLSMISTIEYIGGLIYPTPFLSKDVRSTKALLMILLTGVFVVNFLFKDKKFASTNTKLSLVSLFIISCVCFKIALGRSDTVHIKAGLILIHVPFYYFIINYFIIFLKKINILNKHLPIILLTFFLILNFNINKNIRIANIPNFFSSVKLLIYKDDLAFLEKDYQELISYYKELVRQEECVQIFTNENAIPYFLRKPTCSKFYTIYTSSPENLQKKMINDISFKKPNYILYESLIDGYSSPKLNLNLVNDYILDNYSLFRKISKWTIYSIN
ncbi:hypothetical protein [Candidatus Pelagibacter bacterium nBUS_32]|uniref:hypothetical protein n=1 Tax=Candidatus Pelagibacter bacterium nBUS_32 TaxID=3374192 RepID=UPI003EBB98B3